MSAVTQHSSDSTYQSFVLQDCCLETKPNCGRQENCQKQSQCTRDFSFWLFVLISFWFPICHRRRRRCQKTTQEIRPVGDRSAHHCVPIDELSHFLQVSILQFQRSGICCWQKKIGGKRHLRRRQVAREPVG